MTAHGPDAATFERATHADATTADLIEGTMAIMFETRKVIRPTAQALASPHLQRDYWKAWQGLARHFAPPRA